MKEIILNSDQIKIVVGTTEPVVLRDAAGTLIGHVTRPPTAEDVAEAHRRLQSDGPWHTTQQVRDHLNSLGRE